MWLETSGKPPVRDAPEVHAPPQGQERQNSNNILNVELARASTTRPRTLIVNHSNDAANAKRHPMTIIPGRR